MEPPPRCWINVAETKATSPPKTQTSASEASASCACCEEMAPSQLQESLNSPQCLRRIYFWVGVGAGAVGKAVGKQIKVKGLKLERNKEALRRPFHTAEADFCH